MHNALQASAAAPCLNQWWVKLEGATDVRGATAQRLRQCSQQLYCRAGIHDMYHICTVFNVVLPIAAIEESKRTREVLTGSYVKLS
jgi:hypothetical protein